jgi:hypothetical protein
VTAKKIIFDTYNLISNPLMNAEPIDIDAIDWADVLVKVEAFTRSLLKAKTWFRGRNTATYLKGKEVNDYVQEAIALFLQKPEVFDPSRGTLVNFLNYYIVRLLVHKDAISDENTDTTDISLYFEDNADEAHYMEKILPYVEAFFDAEIDYKATMNELETSIEGETIVEQIYMGITSGLKRREIIKEFEMTEQEYDNGKRRLQTILKRVLSKYDIAIKKS